MIAISRTTFFPLMLTTVAQKLTSVGISHDRAVISPQKIEQMRQEILEVISRYVELEPEG